MTLDYSIIAFKALNISVLMTIPIGSISIVLLIRSLFLSRRVQFITSAFNSTPQKQKSNKRDQPSEDKNKYVDPIQLKHD